MRETRLGPSVSAMAMARFSSTTGEAVRRASSPVQLGDLRPVARRLGVQGGDRRLENVGPPATEGERPVELGASIGDLLGAPA